MEQRRDPAQKKMRIEKELATRELENLQRDPPYSLFGKFPLDISPLRMHLGGQLGLVCSFAVALISLIWTYQKGDTTLMSLSNTAALQAFVCALIVGGAAQSTRLESSWAWLMTLGLLGQDAICLQIFSNAAQNSVALLWILGAGALLLYTFSRHLPLALLGIFNFYASAQLLGPNLPLTGLLCLFLLWSSFFSFISVMLKCRALSWAGLYLAPLFFHRVYHTVLLQNQTAMSPFYLGLLIAMQLLQVGLFGTSVAGYTGSYRQPLSPRQTWWYFPILLLIFLTYTVEFGHFGIWYRAVFDLICLLLVSAGFIGVAGHLLKAPLSDLTMVHALSAVIALDLTSQLTRWYAAQYLDLGQYTAIFPLAAEMIAGSLCALSLGFCAKIFGENLSLIWRKTELRMAILVSSGLGLMGIYRLLFEHLKIPYPLGVLTSAGIALVYGVGLHLIFQRASASWYQSAPRVGKLGIGFLFLLQCACWSILAQKTVQFPIVKTLPLLRADQTQIS